MYYTGGKGRAYQQLINLMPPHRVYVETHLGSGAVLRHKRLAQISIGIDIDPLVISGWRRRNFDHIQIIRSDSIEWLKTFDFKGDELIYADPPYVPETRRRRRCYRYDYTITDHERLLDVLSVLPCRVMLSGYQNSLYDGRLSSWRRIDFASITQVGLRQESVWLNFPPTPFLHDYSFIGHDFREREQLRRWRHSLTRRFASSAPLVINAALSDLADRFPDAVIAAADRVRQ